MARPMKGQMGCFVTVEGMAMTPRKLQGFEVIVDGVKRPIVGKLAMDQMMISLPYELPIAPPSRLFEPA